MRYIDSGDRDPSNTLATWIAGIVPSSISELRLQAGFFSHRSLPYIDTLLDELTNRSANVSLLLGSNDGMTSKADISSLLSRLGSDRAGLRIGIVRFAGSYFHPKSYHLTRTDGSATAYVGSANFTPKGLAQHVEAGVILDTAEGDDSAVIAKIAASTDAWFSESRAGLHVINSTTDLDALVAARVIGVPRPTAPSGSRPASAPRLARLVPPPSMPTTVALSWSKVLDQSNAQRKPGGNNRGSITLTRGRAGDTQTFFRNVLFGTAPWVAGFTRTGQPIDTALIPMRVKIDGVNLGFVQMEVSDSPYRQQGTRNNATSHLHVGALAPEFTATDMTGKTLTVELLSDGTYTLEIV